MTRGDGFERVPQREADSILARVLRFRRKSGALGKPHDVNNLLWLFPRVTLREGYLLDYVEQRGQVASWIRPYARRREDSPLASLPDEIHLFDRHTIVGYDQPAAARAAEIDLLYRHLSFEWSAPGVFQYAFFLVELGSVRADGHAAEWLDSCPVFTKRRFDSFVRPPRDASLRFEEPATRVDRPTTYSPLARIDADGGRVAFLVHTPVGSRRIYYLNCAVDVDGCLSCEHGDTVAELGGGFVY